MKQYKELQEAAYMLGGVGYDLIQVHAVEVLDEVVNKNERKIKKALWVLGSEMRKAEKTVTWFKEERQAEFFALLESGIK